MSANTPTTIDDNFEEIKRVLDSNDLVSHCAQKYGNTGDPTSMKVCYLLRHHPELSVSQLADLAGVSISAMSRCLKKLSHSEVLVARKDKQTVYYCLQDNEFTRALIKQLGGAS